MQHIKRMEAPYAQNAEAFAGKLPEKIPWHFMREKWQVTYCTLEKKMCCDNVLSKEGVI